MSTIITPIIIPTPAPRPKCPTCGQEIREESTPSTLSDRLGWLAVAAGWVALTVFIHPWVELSDRTPMDVAIGWFFSAAFAAAGAGIAIAIVAFIAWVIVGDE